VIFTLHSVSSEVIGHVIACEIISQD